MLEIALLGEITILSQGKPITQFRSQKELALLVYLAHTGETVKRELIADLLWDARSTSQSLSNLRTALARLRKWVGDALIVTRKTVAVSQVVHEQTDSVRFQGLAAARDSQNSVTAVNLLKQGLDLYHGEMMAGISLPSAPRFNDWLVIEQERLRQIAMQGFRQLAGWQEHQGDFSNGVVTAQKWVHWEPLDETAQQQLMRLLAYDGRLTEAMAVYEKCRLLLQTELGISPATSTTNLYDAIRAGTLAPPDISHVPLNNLPRALTSLFGRKKEIEELNRYLLNPDFPLISITGVGGIGKTSLALAATRALTTSGQHPYSDGIWFVSLEEIENDNPEKVRDRVAALIGLAMGIYFHGETNLWSLLLGQLASKNLLLILDNIEQFLPTASDLIMELLAESQHIQLLITSQITLPLSVNYTFPLSGLEIPTQSTAEALQNDSVRLFAERVARLPTPFDLESHLTEVVTICQFVEGMPLAIELAAASLGRLMIEEIMPVLRSNLQLLVTTRRDLPDRHRTLRAVFDYTWQLLDQAEQSILAQIAIFRGGFTRQAAEAVINNSPDTLYNLLDHALLNRDETGRFRIHPLLRQLAREKLSTELEQLSSNRHALFFTSQVKSLEKDLQYGENQEVVQTVLVEQANLRAAWHYAVQTKQWQIIADCLDGAHYFFSRKGLYREEALLLDSAIIALQDVLVADDHFLTGLLSRLLSTRALNYQWVAEYEKGLKLAEQACQLAQKTGDPGIEAVARDAMAKLHFRDHASALAQYQQVVSLAKAAQNPILEAEALSAIGGQQIWQGKRDQAEEPLRRALNIFQTLHYKPGEMMVLIRLGRLLGSREAYSETIGLEDQALQLSRQLGDVLNEALILGNIGVNKIRLGDLVSSQRYQEKALAIYRRLQMPGEEQILLGGLGQLATLLGDYATAEQHLTEALALAEQVEDDFWQAWVKLRTGEMWNETGEFEKALVLLTEAAQAAEKFQYINFKAGVLYVWGQVLINQGNWSSASEKLQLSYNLRESSGRTEQALPSLAAWAYAALKNEQTETAVALADQLSEKLEGNPAMAERANLKVYWWLGMVWDELADSRANNLWSKAARILQAHSKKIPDTHQRKQFLEKVPAHRAIIANTIPR